MSEPRPDTQDFVTWIITLVGWIVAYRLGLHSHREAHRLAMIRENAQRHQSACDKFLTVIADCRSAEATKRPFPEGIERDEERHVTWTTKRIREAINDARVVLGENSINGLEIILTEYRAYLKDRWSGRNRQLFVKDSPPPQKHNEFLSRFEQAIRQVAQPCAELGR